MAKFSKSLSKKKTLDGKKQIMVRLFVSHSCIIRLKSPVWVKEDLFDTEREEIIIPKKTKTNAILFQEAAKAKSELEYYLSRVLGIVAAGTPDGKPITKDWIEHLIELQDNEVIGLGASNLTQTKIESALKKEQDLDAENKAKEEAKEREAAKIKTELPNAIEVFLSHQKLCQGRIYAYKVLQGMINRFTMYKREIGDRTFTMYLDTVTLEDLEDFRDYVRNEASIAETHKRIFKKILEQYPIASNPKRPKKLEARGDNYIISVIKRVKAVFNWFIKQGLTTNNPTTRLEMGLEIYGLPIYITKAERDQIADYDLSKASEHIQQQRDIFVFQCLVGCRVGDLLKLTPANINNGILEYVPSKTKDHTHQVKPRVPLSQRALDLIKKYEGVDPFGRLFPFISAQKYNENIREVFKLCKMERTVIVRNTITGQNELKPIWEVASSHMARRTFVGAAYKVVKDPNLIGAMSGHVPGSQAFNRYRQIDDEDLMSVISAIG